MPRVDRDCIILKEVKQSVSQEGLTVNYIYSCPDRMKAFIRKPIDANCLYVKYPTITEILPPSIVSIPFAGVMYTVAGLLNCDIEVSEIDEEFGESIPRLNKVFKQLYPKANIECRMMANTQISTKTRRTAGGASLFFTGGVDATSALATTLPESPFLINIQGGDIPLSDISSHEDLDGYISKIASHLNLKYCFIATNARAMFEEDRLGYLCSKLGRNNNHGWWASIAHIVSMVSVSAPVFYTSGISRHYIGSSYEAGTRIFDSNNAEIISAMKSAGTLFEIVNDKEDRVQKIENIVRLKKQTNAPIELKVCWYREKGKNCSSCEKCYRTIMNLIVNNEDPNKYGFNVDKEKIEEIRRFLLSHRVNYGFWSSIQKRFLEKMDCIDDEWKWFANIKINSMSASVKSALRKLGRQ